MKTLCSLLILSAILFSVPAAAFADGAGDARAQSLLKEMKNRYLDQKKLQDPSAASSDPSKGLPPPPSSPPIPPMPGGSGSGHSGAPENA